MQSVAQFYQVTIYLFSFLLTINLKLIIVHVEIKIVNKEAVTERNNVITSTTSVVHNRCTFEQSSAV